MRTHSSDPGNEHKETLATLAQTANAGGFSIICVLPNSEPSINSKSAVEYVINQSKNLPVTLLPFGTLSNKIPAFGHDWQLGKKEKVIKWKARR